MNILWRGSHWSQFFFLFFPRTRKISVHNQSIGTDQPCIQNYQLDFVVKPNKKPHKKTKEIKDRMHA